MALTLVRDDTREDRKQQQDHHDDATGDRRLVLPEARPEDLTRATPLDGRLNCTSLDGPRNSTQVSPSPLLPKA